MPHSSRKNVDAPMDAWDRQRCGLALLSIEKHLELLSYHVGEMRDANSKDEIAAGIGNVRAAVRQFIDETD